MTLVYQTSTSSGVTFQHCPFCWYTVKSKAAMTKHVNAEHEEEKEKAEELDEQQAN